MRLLRCTLVVLATTAAAVGALWVLVPSVVTRTPGFEGVLVSGCAALAAGCAVWGWVGAIAVVVEAVRVSGGVAGGDSGDVLGSASGVVSQPTMPGVPTALRRLVLAGCGVALTATAGPALGAPGADTQHGLPAVVAGLPFPARAMDLPAQTHRAVVVRPGDSLWAIAALRLPHEASDAAITDGWQDLYARNRAVVGDDPSLIHPGQRLVLPTRLEESS